MESIVATCGGHPLDNFGIKMSKRIFLGLCTGRAADGIDAALVAITGDGEDMSVTQLAHADRMYPQDISRRILALEGGHTEPLRALTDLDRDIASAAAATARILLDEAKVDIADVEAVGWSGQTVCVSGNESGKFASMELGSPARIAAKLHTTVVDRFAESDIAAGGVGGPVTAHPEWLMFRDQRLSRVLVHLGGVATLTFVPPESKPCDVVAYDVGPGTIVIDEMVHKFHHKPYDMDGSIAGGAKPNLTMLNELQATPWFQQDPPKRVNMEDWSAKYVWRILQIAQKHNCSGADMISTVTELTARTICDAVGKLTQRPHEIILTGGGAMNIQLSGRIRELLSPCSTYTVEKYGFSIRGKQPACYAVLAAARLDAYPAHCHCATGAKAPAILGSVTLG
jgi:anhydro-N-acetylmuramic acid kinase